MNKQIILIIAQTLFLFLNIAYLIITSKEIEKDIKVAIAVLISFGALSMSAMLSGTRVLLGIIFFIIGIIQISIQLIKQRKVTVFLKMPFYIINTYKKISVIILFLWVIGIIFIYFNLYSEWFVPAGGMLVVWIIKVMKDNTPKGIDNNESNSDK